MLPASSTLSDPASSNAVPSVTSAPEIAVGHGDDDPVRPTALATLASRPRALWQARGLLQQFVLRDLRVRYRQAVLGLMWALLIPALTILAGSLVRLVAVRGSASIGGADRATLAGVVVKAVAWSFFSGSLSFATTSRSNNAALVTRIYFPREVLPLASVLAQGVDLLAASLTAVALLAVLGIGVTPATLWAAVLLAILVVLTAAISAVFACANLFFRDVRYLTQVLTTFGLFFTPVFLDAAQFGARGSRIVMLNPVAPVLEGLRLAIVNGHDLSRPLVLPSGIVAWHPWYLVWSAAWAGVSVVASALLYARLELSFAEYV